MVMNTYGVSSLFLGFKKGEHARVEASETVDKSATKSGKMGRENWEENGKLADGKGWLRPWKRP